MKKFLVLATAALMISGISLADTGKKKKKCKGKTCCTETTSAEKSCCKTNGKTAKI